MTGRAMLSLQQEMTLRAAEQWRADGQIMRAQVELCRSLCIPREMTCHECSTGPARAWVSRWYACYVGKPWDGDLGKLERARRACNKRRRGFTLQHEESPAVMATSAAATADNTISNKVHVGVQCLGPTDMANDGAMQLQYYSGSGTNKLTFRGRIPEAAVAGGYIADLNGTYAMATDGSSAVVDGNGTAVTAADADHDGSTPGAGANGSSAIFGTDVLKTGSSVNTLTTTAGSSSGSVAVLTGVVFG